MEELNAQSCAQRVCCNAQSWLPYQQVDYSRCMLLTLFLACWNQMFFILSCIRNAVIFCKQRDLRGETNNTIIKLNCHMAKSMHYI